MNKKKIVLAKIREFISKSDHVFYVVLSKQEGHSRWVEHDQHENWDDAVEQKDSILKQNQTTIFNFLETPK